MAGPWLLPPHRLSHQPEVLASDLRALLDAYDGRKIAADAVSPRRYL